MYASVYEEIFEKMLGREIKMTGKSLPTSRDIALRCWNQIDRKSSKYSWEHRKAMSLLCGWRLPVQARPNRKPPETKPPARPRKMSFTAVNLSTKTLSSPAKAFSRRNTTLSCPAKALSWRRFRERKNFSLRREGFSSWRKRNPSRCPSKTPITLSYY